MTEMPQSSEPHDPSLGHPMSHGKADLNCEQLVTAITDYLDGAMTPEDRARLEFHLSLCPPCQIYLDQIKVTIAATGRLRTSDVSPEAKAVLIALFRTWSDNTV